jgi:hypothetical protein
VLAGAMLAICIGVVSGAIIMLPARPCLSKANFDRIEMGMTREEVERILGQPTGQADRIDDGIAEVVWIGADDARARIEFANGVVRDMAFQESNETAWDKLRRWTRVVW